MEPRASAGEGAGIPWARKHASLAKRVGGTRLLLAIVIWPLTTHPCLDRPQFLLLLQTPPTVDAVDAHYVFAFFV